MLHSSLVTDSASTTEEASERSGEAGRLRWSVPLAGAGRSDCEESEVYSYIHSYV